MALELALVDLRGVAILLGKCIGTLQKIAKPVIQHQLQQWYANLINECSSVILLLYLIYRLILFRPEVFSQPIENSSGTLVAMILA